MCDERENCETSVRRDQAEAYMARVHELILQLRHRWRRTERCGELSWPQWFLLRHLRCHGPSHPHMLADRLGVTRSTLTGLLDVLQERGYIERSPDPGDRRTLWIGITAAGRKALQRCEEYSRRRVVRALRALDVAEADVLVRSLEKLIGAWGQESEANGADGDGEA
ncbi:MAG: MarR family transcriptional regulator [Bacillota bacterium]